MEHQFGSSRWEVHARVRSPPDDDDDDEDDDFHDDGPLLTYNNEKYRRYPTYTDRDGDRHNSEERERGKRSTLGVLFKFTLFCTAMILFCVLMYIPMYNRVIEHLPKDVVAGWTVHTNRDTKIYVQPNNVTLLHEPKQLCPKLGSKKKLYLLIIVCSSTVNFERRKAIRETWGSYKNYLELTKLYATIREKYRSYNYTYDLYPQPTSSVNSSLEVNRTKRDIGLNQILPRLAEVLKKNMESKTEVATEEKRFDDDVDDKVITEFDMNKQFDDSNNDLQNYDYDYESNVMKIPPKGEEENKSLGDVLKALKVAHDIIAQEQEEKETVIEFSEDLDLDYKVAFLLGVPLENNTTAVQDLIEEEVNKYGDVIQENFIDSYNNLTLKSIMMLKYVTSNCKETVRYILKTDDDMFINLPNLMRTLRNKSREFDARVAAGYKEKEYLLVGDLIAGAKPVLDASNKWFAPRYLYPGRVYPRYLSGTGYVLAAAAAAPLYRAALGTPYLHLEDVYITGICAMRAVPRLRPAGAPGFNGRTVRAAAAERACSAHAQVTSHRLSAGQLQALSAAMRDTALLDKCERIRLTQVRRDRLKPKTPPNRLTKAGKSLT